jgi:hypothetical protein
MASQFYMHQESISREDDSTKTYDFTEADKENTRRSHIVQIQNNEEVSVSGVSRKLNSTKRPTLLEKQEAYCWSRMESLLNSQH